MKYTSRRNKQNELRSSFHEGRKPGKEEKIQRTEKYLPGFGLLGGNKRNIHFQLFS